MAAGKSSFPDLFFNQVARYQDRVALRHKDYGIWKRISWKEYGEMVRVVAAGLISLGVQRGDKVSILGENRPEWLFCDLGNMSVGGVSVGVYPTSAPDQVAYVVGHSESQVLFIENEEQVDKVLQILPELQVKQVVVWDPKGLWGFSQERIIFFDEFLKRAK
ncbi:MAG: AMP-binding protein, partial [Desulfobacterota bacterium]|nr:AMP-binding protein [Thermodesulfobacteriota bacterium]